MSTIATNTITNVAGNATGVGIAVSNAATYNSEGGAVTQNLVQGLAKAWINFAGNGASINDSLNISSLADNGTGIFTITMSSAMGNANYDIAIGIKELGGGNNHTCVVRGDVTVTTTLFAIRTYSTSTPQDVTAVYNTVHGDLA